ncbi:MAG: YdeI/OmpD-associated family protein [Bacteroidetes bacterium]|nr:YdeI/OmpD-associated family protein [Bacteroidota bacterium]
MGKKDPRVDDYIIKSEEFAQPILVHLRNLVHHACPGVEETIKWKFPVFQYHGNLCDMASFKKHCVFGFWKGVLLSDPAKILNPIGESAMGQFGRLTTLSDLPADEIIIAYLKEAMFLNETNVKVPIKEKTLKKELDVPGYFYDALSQNKNALETFEKFSYSNKKDYVEWIKEAKTEATRNKRMETAVEWMAEGKIKNWKYVK